jgi:glycosyltransferase involved in cell wall biosynthesis
MKIDVQWVHSLSGLDTWMSSFVQSLRGAGRDVESRRHGQMFRFFPYLLDGRSSGDVLYTNSWEGGFLGKKGDIPVVATEQLVVHDPLYDTVKTPAQRMFHRMVYSWERKCFSLAACIVAPSRYVQRRLREVFHVDAEVIPNGIPLDIFRPGDLLSRGNTSLMPGRKAWKDKGKTVLLFAGNPTARKGWPLLLALMEELERECVLLAATGFRSYRKNAPTNVKIVGTCPRNELPKFYNSGDIFIFPSRLEGFGLAAAEAMACGKPVVTTKSSSLPELVVDGKGGFLCDPGDPGQFLEKVRLLAANPAMQREFGEFNRARCEERFDLTKISALYTELFDSLIGH